MVEQCAMHFDHNVKHDNIPIVIFHPASKDFGCIDTPANPIIVGMIKINSGDRDDQIN